MYRLLLILSLLVAVPANAQIIPFLFGVALASDGSTTITQPQPIFLKATNPNHDVIMCRATPENQCAVADSDDTIQRDWNERTHSWSYRSITPYQFAGNAGYRTLYSRAILVLQKLHGNGSTENITYVVMEVSR